MFFLKPLYVHISVFILLDAKILTNKLKLGFHCTRHSMTPFLCQQILKGNSMLNVTKHDATENTQPVQITCKYKVNFVCSYLECYCSQ